MINSIHIVSIAIITVFGSPSPRTYAQPCMNPLDPDCISTNPPTGTNYSDYTWPTNGLVWSLAGSNQFDLHTLVPNFLYEIEGSPDLHNWTLLKEPFTNGLTNSFSIETTNTQMFFRAQSVMFKTIYANASAQVGSATCGGNYSNLAIYVAPYTTNGWYQIDNRTVVHSVSDGLNNNLKIEYNGKLGDFGCFTGGGYITNPFSPSYRFIVFFPGTVPTNPYPLTLSGFITNN